MDCVTLLEEARLAGLTVLIDGGKLVVRGPRRAEPVALRVLRHKPDVLATLERQSVAGSATGELTEIVDRDIAGNLGADTAATSPDHYIATSPARQQIIDLLLPVYRADQERALILRDRWMERLSIVAVDPDCAPLADPVAFEEIRGGLNSNDSESDLPSLPLHGESSPGEREL